MRDEFIKNLIDENKIVPKKSANEWVQILKSIEEHPSEKKTFFDYKIFVGLVACSLASFFIYNSNIVNQSSTLSMAQNEELDAYFMENTYIDEEQDLYAWADF